MPRQSRSRPAARSAPASAPAQSRSHTTAAAPSQGYGRPPAAPPVPQGAVSQPASGGMFGRVAENVASIAAGSVIGHGISRAVFGGGESAAAPAGEQPLAQAAPAQNTSSGISCEFQAKNFSQCLEKADFPSCNWYFEQLKACQEAAKPY